MNYRQGKLNQRGRKMTFLRGKMNYRRRKIIFIRRKREKFRWKISGFESADFTDERRFSIYIRIIRVICG
jgi:hypothetical protein